jgi:hypothetical protein
MKAYGAVYVDVHVFLTSSLAGGEWPASHPGRFTRGTQWIGVFVGSRGDLDAVDRRKLLPPPGLEPRPLRPSSLSLSRFRVTRYKFANVSEKRTITIFMVKILIK